MSASTASIAANSAAQRAPVVVGQKNFSDIELLPNEAQVNGGGVAIGSGVDLSVHCDLGNAGQERTSKPRRTRRTASNPKKPRLVTVVSVFTTHLVLVMALIGLVQMVRRLVLMSGDNPVVLNEIGLSEFEGRIAEVESFLKTTAKLIRIQVEAVDEKMEKEVGEMRREVSKKMDGSASILESGLKELEARSEEFEKSIVELKAVDWLSKEKLGTLYEELKKGKSGELGGIDANLDDMTAYARGMMEKEIEKHAADGLGRVDYALASGGAMVLKHSEPFMPKETKWFSIKPLEWFCPRGSIHPDATKMLKPSFGEPGQCFPLKGSSGFVQIRLRTAITPEAITLEHVAKSIAYDRSSAPKDCRVSGWLEGHNFDLAVGAEKMFLLREFTYDLQKSNAQTFDVLDSAASGLIDTVRLDFTSNHGISTHTCIYRLRVHGYEPDTVSVMKMQS